MKRAATRARAHAEVEVETEERLAAKEVMKEVVKVEKLAVDLAKTEAEVVETRVEMTTLVVL